MTREYPGASKFRDRYGVWRWRARAKGKKTAMLHGDYGSPEFVAEWQSWSSGQPLPIGKALVLPGTISSLMVDYYGATHHGIKASTLRAYRNALERFRVKNGSKPLASLKPEGISKIRLTMKPDPANMLLRALRHMCAYAVAAGKMKRNPTDGLKKFATDSDGHKTWEIEQVEAFEAKYPVGSKERLALALLLYTAQRRSDVVLLGRQHERQGGKFLGFRQVKTGAWVELPIWSPLKAALATGPKGSMTYLETAYGRPFSAAGFGNWFGEKCRAAGLKGYTAHGLRKAAATRLAEAGATAHEIMAVTGHTSLSEVQRYTKAAAQKTLAQSALGKLETQFAKTDAKSLKNKRTK